MTSKPIARLLTSPRPEGRWPLKLAKEKKTGRMATDWRAVTPQPGADPAIYSPKRTPVTGNVIRVEVQIRIDESLYPQNQRDSA